MIGRTGKYEEAKGYATIKSLPQVNDHTTNGVETIVYVNVSHYKIDRPQPPSSLVHVILLACDVVFSTLIVVHNMLGKWIPNGAVDLSVDRPEDKPLK
ncbi:hypothetical protein Tco_0949531 [Tanacetum coccineum]